MDRNWWGVRKAVGSLMVALRKESVDRNCVGFSSGARADRSLSARRAWIEIYFIPSNGTLRNVALRKESVDRNSKNPVIRVDEVPVALRKESVDRNPCLAWQFTERWPSLSARRAWIEIIYSAIPAPLL